MCGIGAFQLVEGETQFARPLCQALLRELEVRGTHASGVAWHDNAENKTWVQKSAQRGSLLAKVVDKELGSTCIVHTRYATQGHQSNNLNNHPLDVNGMVGVHNGHVSNDNELISLIPNYKRQGQVDSEAAFAYLQHGPKSLGLAGRLAKINGGAALIWLNSCGPRRLLHIARLRNSPLCFAHTEAGSVIVASTKAILLASCKQAGVKVGEVTELAEGTYVRFENGALTQLGDIPIPEPVRASTYAYGGYPPKPVVSNTGTYKDGVWKTQLDLFLEETDYENAMLEDWDNAVRKDK